MPEADAQVKGVLTPDQGGSYVEPGYKFAHRSQLGIGVPSLPTIPGSPVHETAVIPGSPAFASARYAKSGLDAPLTSTYSPSYKYWTNAPTASPRVASGDSNSTENHSVIKTPASTVGLPAIQVSKADASANWRTKTGAHEEPLIILDDGEGQLDSITHTDLAEDDDEGVMTIQKLFEKFGSASTRVNVSIQGSSIYCDKLIVSSKLKPPHSDPCKMKILGEFSQTSRSHPLHRQFDS